MPECPHIAVMLVGEHLECVECHSQDLSQTVTIALADLVRLTQLVQGIVDSLTMAGMTDTAQMVKEHASKLTITPQLVWRN